MRNGHCSDDKHRVAVTVEAIARGDGLAIGVEDSLAAGERGDEHQQRGSRQMEVRNQTGHDAELMARMNEEARLATCGRDRPALSERKRVEGLIIWGD